MMKLLSEPYTPADIEQNPRLRDALRLLDDGAIASAVAELQQQAALGLAGAAFLLVAVYHQEGRPHDVIAAVTTREALQSNSQAWMLAGMAHITLGNPREGYHLLKRALQLDWENLPAHRLMWNAIDALGARSLAQARIRAVLKDEYSEDLDGSHPNPPDLSCVTLCAVDSVYPEVSARALRISAAQCRFGAVKLLTSVNMPSRYFQVVNIPHIGSVEAYSAFVMQGLKDHIDTEFVLVIQWDGYVLSPQAWETAFLNFDYIGARWTPAHIEAESTNRAYDVGNGGFSLRSKRFLSAAASMTRGLALSRLHPEDAIACRVLRPELEKSANIRFASGAVADRFSMEHSITGKPTFGFHDFRNLALAINDPRYSRLDCLDGLI